MLGGRGEYQLSQDRRGGGGGGGGGGQGSPSITSMLEELGYCRGKT